MKRSGRNARGVATITALLLWSCHGASAQNLVDTSAIWSGITPGANLFGKVDASNFLGEVKGLVTASNARELMSMSRQAAELALKIEDVKIQFLKGLLCNGNLPTGQYAKEVAQGCELLALHHELNQLSMKAVQKLPY